MMSDLRCELDTIAARVHEQAGLAVPVDLRALSSFLGVASVRRMEMVESGRLSWEGGEPVVYLRSRLKAGPRRFTWAHELSHLILESELGEPLRGGLPPMARDSADRERLCDHLAAALLLPESWVRDELDGDDLTLEQLLVLQRRADVSVTAALVRVRELFGCTAGLASYTRRRGRIDCRPLCGLPGDWSVRSLPSRNAGGPGKARFRVGGRTYPARVEISGDDRGLIFLPNVPWVRHSGSYGRQVRAS